MAPTTSSVQTKPKTSDTLAAVAAAVVDGWPPPSDQQLARVAAILNTAAPALTTSRKVVQAKLAHLVGGA